MMQIDIDFVATRLDVLVKGYRTRMGLTQVVFGQLVGLSERLVQIIESGKGNPRLSTLMQLLRLMAIEPEYGILQDRACTLRDMWFSRGPADTDLFLALMRSRGWTSFQRMEVGYLRRMPDGSYLLEKELKHGNWLATVLITHHTRTKMPKIQVHGIFPDFYPEKTKVYGLWR